ncbi:MAG TPA: LON peptidase substrate-binding domain-containing protein [Longimicrobiales bacterium]|nr:LON peptidase substrate-binding domain-containing protein [Longimicrobiales bacterium]
MRRLPLFVLPVVLLPGATLPLHVFEPRYRRMIARALEGDRRFGLLHASDDVPFELEEGQIGCVAEILEFRPLPDGRSLVVCRGSERFRVVDGIENNEDYDEALVDEYPDADNLPGDIVERRRRVLELFRSVVEQDVTASGLSDVALPEEDDGDVSFRIASFLSLPTQLHQQLLELPSERARLNQLESWLRTQRE